MCDRAPALPIARARTLRTLLESLAPQHAQKRGKHAHLTDIGRLAVRLARHLRVRGESVTPQSSRECGGGLGERKWRGRKKGALFGLSQREEKMRKLFGFF